MKKTIEVGTDLLLLMAKNLLVSGEITKEQYLKMVQRNETLPVEIKKDIIIVKEEE